MYFSNEWKSPISRTDVMTLDHRLCAVTRRDYYAGSGHYTVHSLHFRTFDELSMHAQSGSGVRSGLFRIRYYNDNPQLLKLEKKIETKGSSVIESCEITPDFVKTVLNRDFSRIVRDPMGRSGDDLDPLLQEFYWNVVGRGLHPVFMLEYSRKPYIYPHGDARVTIDYNFRKSRDVSGFLNPHALDDTAVDDHYFIKVKWNSYLPELIKSAVTLSGRPSSSFYLHEPLKIYV